MERRHEWRQILSASASWPLGIFLVLVIAVAPGCTSSDDDEAVCKLNWEDATLNDQTICASGQFTGTSTNISNAFLPFGSTTGRAWTLDGEEDGETVRVETTVQGTDTKAGVAVRVVNEKEYVEGVLVEDTLDWYAQSDSGAVCYFGEAVTNYEDGATNTEGSWVADYATYFPGIIMPAEANIQVGTIYIQERAPDVAEDMSEITGIGEVIATTAGTFSDTFTGNDCNPLDREPEDKKIYARNVGLVYDAGVTLTSHTP